jgi:hypothetical protein
VQAKNEYLFNMNACPAQAGPGATLGPDAHGRKDLDLTGDDADDAGDE